MRLLVLLLILPFAASAAAPDSDGFIWIDANTRIKVKPVSAAAGGTAPQKAPEKKDPKEEPKK